MIILNNKINDYVNNNSAFVLDCDSLDVYDFPVEDEIPERHYASMIMGIRPYRDKFKNDYFDVCYKIFPTYLCSWWFDNQIEKITYFYIRQRYLRGSDEERRFRSAMFKICNRTTLNAYTGDKSQLPGASFHFTQKLDEEYHNLLKAGYRIFVDDTGSKGSDMTILKKEK